jgi:hypothetical protein
MHQYRRQLAIMIPAQDPHGLHNCMKQIAIATFGVDFEVIIAGTAATIKRFKDLDQAEPTVNKDKIQTETIEVWPGRCRAIARATEMADAEWLTTLDDFCRPEPGWAYSAIEFIQKIEDQLTVGAMRILTEHEHARFYYYGILNPRYPILRHQTARCLGGFIDPAYRHYCGTADLGIRAATSCGKIVICPHAWIGAPTRIEIVGSKREIEAHQEYYQSDIQEFKERWAPYFKGEKEAEKVEVLNGKSKRKPIKISA